METRSYSQETLERQRDKMDGGCKGRGALCGRTCSFPYLMSLKITYAGINMAAWGCLMLIQALHEHITAEFGHQPGESCRMRHKTTQPESSTPDDGYYKDNPPTQAEPSGSGSGGLRGRRRRRRRRRRQHCRWKVVV